MAYLDKVKLPDGITYDLQGIEYIVGTQTAATNAWTGVTRSAELYTGKAIIYKLPYAGTGTAATLNLTLSGGGTTGAKSVQRLNNSGVTTHYPVNSVLFLVYDGDRWRHDAEYDSTNIYQLRNNNGTYLTSAALYRYQILLQKNETTLIPVSNGNNNTATGKTITTTQFDPFGEIYYYNSTVTVAANAAIGATTLYQQMNLNMAYAFNTTNTLTCNKDVYLVATPTTAGKAKLHSTPTTQALPTSDNGLIYIRLGHASSTTNVEIHPAHPVYWYKGGSIVQWNPDGLKSVSRSGTTWTFTRNDGTTTTVAQQDNNSTYTMSISTAANSTLHLVSGSSTVANVTIPNTTNTTYGAATTAANGLMTAADKIKLNAMSTYDRYSATSDGLVPSYQSYLDNKFPSSFIVNGDIVLTADQNYYSAGWNRANDFIKVQGSGNQNLTSGSVTNITLSVDVFGTNPDWYGSLDTGVVIDSPGYYEVVGSAFLAPTTASGLCGVYIRLDSTEQGSQFGAVGDSSTPRAMMVGPIIVKVTESYQKLYLAARCSRKASDSSTVYGVVDRGHHSTFLQVKRIGPI